MGYENTLSDWQILGGEFSYRDDEGEPLVDFDEDVQSEGDQPHQHVLDDDVYDREEEGYNGEKARSLEKKRKAEKGEKKFKVRIRKSGGGRMKDHEADPDMKEMWDTNAGDNSEDDQEGVRTLDDDNFIDDTGVDPSDRYGSGNEHSPIEGEQDDEIKELFKIGKKKKKNEKSPAEMALLVENVMAELEVVAEEDAELNRQGKPAINKLKKLFLLTDVLSKLCNLQFPIDLEQFDRREQLKKSGLGKVIMFLSKSDEETTANRKLAKELVDKWSRPIFNKSTRFEDMKNFEDERAYRRPPAKKVMSNAAGRASRDDDLDLPELSQGRKSGPSSSRQHASRPEAMSMDFVVRPQSKVDPEAVRARAKQMMNKKLQQLKAPKRKQLQATKLSVEGRGMVKYL
ncbi:Transcription elongation factor family protein [Perilla frutescens var. hirtella]|uniref:Transcription elongation factor family protein n=1 Tax=Perilla frutescens var. hirtella TaxID=608512 RepID=A0AAD4P116_PERFH|nr:Transcription elongation factor family protein [Perilla frutescens var. hirtella]